MTKHYLVLPGGKKYGLPSIERKMTEMGAIIYPAEKFSHPKINNRLWNPYPKTFINGLHRYLDMGYIKDPYDDSNRFEWRENKEKEFPWFWHFYEGYNAAKGNNLNDLEIIVNRDVGIVNGYRGTNKEEFEALTSNIEYFLQQGAKAYQHLSFDERTEFSLEAKSRIYGLLSFLNNQKPVEAG